MVISSIAMVDPYCLPPSVIESVTPTLPPLIRIAQSSLMGLDKIQTAFCFLTHLNILVRVRLLSQDKILSPCE